MAGLSPEEVSERWRKTRRLLKWYAAALAIPLCLGIAKVERLTGYVEGRAAACRATPPP